MTSGTNKPEYTREQKLQWLFGFQKKAADDFFEAAKRINDKLTREGISKDEFVQYCQQQESATKAPR